MVGSNAAIGNPIYQVANWLQVQTWYKQACRSNLSEKLETTKNAVSK